MSSTRRRALVADTLLRRCGPQAETRAHQVARFLVGGNGGTVRSMDRVWLSMLRRASSLMASWLSGCSRWSERNCLSSRSAWSRWPAMRKARQSMKVASMVTSCLVLLKETSVIIDGLRIELWRALVGDVVTGHHQEGAAIRC